jgi:hypothetical protein
MKRNLCSQNFVVLLHFLLLIWITRSVLYRLAVSSGTTKWKFCIELAKICASQRLWNEVLFDKVRSQLMKRFSAFYVHCSVHKSSPLVPLLMQYTHQLIPRSGAIFGKLTLD